ncbi:MAG TPA: hypothetical protein VJ548_07220 [Azospira sp.]|nr:hypothetical protein [Azospira sp.]
MFSADPQISAQIAIYLANPLVLLALFIAASVLMIWRLHAMEHKGFEGTVLGTLIMPYCSGAANLIFAFVMSRAGGNGKAVLENCIVNNVTNLTLILGLAAVFCSSPIIPKAGAKGKGKKKPDAYHLYRLDLLFTLIALFLFTGTLWALAKDGSIGFYDGVVLVGLFLFWQLLHVFEILKNNVRKNQSLHWSIVIDLLLIGVSAYCIYLSVDHLVTWVSTAQNRFFSVANLGWLSGALMVLPNAILALYYARAGRQDIVVTSQIGDGHICIPMCIGLFALSDTINIPAFFQTGLYILLGAGVVHFLTIALLGRQPRILGIGLLGAYAVFLYQGVIQ